MEQKELNKILESHKRWLKGEGGEPADLTWKNLRGKDLAGKDLYGVSFYKTDLYETDLSGADLRRANFENVMGLSVLCIQVDTSCDNRRITYIPSLDVVTAGCFQGTFEEFEKRVEEEHKNDPFVLSRYRRVIAFLKREAEEDRAREKEMATVDEEE